MTYEFSSDAAALSKGFVEQACEVVRKQRTVAGVLERTWLDNYVGRLSYLFKALKEFQKIDRVGCPKSIEYYTLVDWTAFGTWFGDLIRKENLAQSTKSKLIYCSNKLFFLLAIGNVIPVKIELEALVSRTRARNGQSKFTLPGHGRTPPLTTAESPFEIRSKKHKRSYNYSPFQPLARRFLLNAAPILAALYEGKSASQAKKCHNSFVNLLTYLVAHRKMGASPLFFELLESDSYQRISSVEWETVLYLWRDQLLPSPQDAPGSRILTTSHAIVKTLAGIWNSLVGERVVPEIQLFGFKNAKKVSATNPHRSLAQLTNSGVTTDTVQQAIWIPLQRYFDDSDQAEAQEFVRALCSEFSPETIKSLSIKELIQRIHALNRSRLNLIRECAEVDFQRWYAHWEVGNATLAKVKHTAQELVYLVDSPTLSVSVRQRNSKQLFFSGPEDVRLGNCLLYVLSTMDGIVTGIGGRYHHIARTFNGRPEFHAFLHPHVNATLSIWIMLQIDTGANAEVVREMPWECLKPGTQPDRYILEMAPKLRADGKRISIELPHAPEEGQRLSAFEAIKCYQKMAERYRSLANSNENNPLLLHETSRCVHKLTEYNGRAWFIKFLGRHDKLRGLRIRPSMLRPSFLMCIQHFNGDNMIAAQVMGDHASINTTAISYTLRTPTKLTYNLLIQEFQQRYQSAIITSIDGAGIKLGLSEEEMRRILSDAARTGLDVACLNPMSGIQPGTKTGCEMSWVVATRENIVDLILFNEYLRRVQTEAASENPDVWETRWLPLLVFSDIALTKLNQGETAAMFAESKALVTSRRATYLPFPLF